jgi:hypothetical protein
LTATEYGEAKVVLAVAYKLLLRQYLGRNL